MTREELINEFQKWLDTKPRKQIIAAECANIAENYASEREKQLRIGSCDYIKTNKMDRRDLVKKILELSLELKDAEGVQAMMCLADMENAVKDYEKQLRIGSVRRSALKWWYWLTPSQQKDYERRTFGDGETWEDNRLTDADIETMYMNYLNELRL